MKKKILLVTAVVICLAIAATGTLAYFTSDDVAHNVITSGGVNIELVEKTEALEAAEAGAGKEECPFKEARYYHDVVFTAMQDARGVADELETVVGAKYWPFPTYGELLFGVR